MKQILPNKIYHSWKPHFWWIPSGFQIYTDFGILYNPSTPTLELEALTTCYSDRHWWFSSFKTKWLNNWKKNKHQHGKEIIRIHLLNKNSIIPKDRWFCFSLWHDSHKYKTTAYLLYCWKRILYIALTSAKYNNPKDLMLDRSKD